VTRNQEIAKDLWVLQASQRIYFDLNEEGVTLESEAAMTFGCSAQPPPRPRHIMIFDKPFLIIMRRAGANQPYFATWIDNAELLIKD
jgi:hypothetical protein